MSWAGRILWIISILSFLIMFVARVYLGGWISLLFVPLATTVIAAFAAVFIDIRYYAEVFTMRTTKYGVSAGFSVLILLVALVSFNVISVQMDQTLDISSEKTNSLSPEIKKILSGLDSELLVSTYYRGPKDKVKLMQIKQTLSPYLKVSNTLAADYINIYQNSTKAQIELKDIPVEDGAIVLVRYKDKKVKVAGAFSKSALSEAITLATREKTKTIYFLLGQGEKSTFDEQSDGLMGLKQVLLTRGFAVENLLLQDLNKLQPGAGNMVASIGSRYEFDAEVSAALSTYVLKGGSLLVATDPAQTQKVQEFVQNFGLLFENNYLISEIGKKFGRAATTSVGLTYNRRSPITSVFKENKKSYTIFETASEIKVTKNESYNKFNYQPLIATSKQSFSVNELTIKIKPGKRSAKTLAVLAKVKEPSKGQVLLVGDSDFLTNKDLLQGDNKQLALNMFSHLSDEADLVSTPKKQVNGTQIVLTDRLRNSIVIAGFFLPFFMFLISGLLFYKRKGA